MPPTFFNWKNKTLILHVLIQPRASKDEIVGLHGDRLKIRLKAPPVDGEANKYLIRYLSYIFQLPKKNICVIKGLTSRQKTVSIQSLSEVPSQLIIALRS